MKRFVTYLYEYENGRKSKNIGFIRVNIRDEKTELQIVIRNCMRTNEAGKVFVLIHTESLLGIELGEIQIRNGQSEGRMIVSTDSVMDSGCSVNEIVGVGIRLQAGGYFASCWKDEFAEEIAQGEFRLEELQKESREDEVLLEEKESMISEEAVPKMENIMEDASVLAVAEEPEGCKAQMWNNNQENANEVTFRKIDLSQLHDLPSPNWYLTTNSFLLHGFWNYGYLVLKKEVEADKKKLSLGVPGIFEKPEAVMAILFGFPEFEALPSEMVEIEMNMERGFSYNEKNQEPRVGLFGCWFVNLKD